MHQSVDSEASRVPVELPGVGVFLKVVLKMAQQWKNLEVSAKNMCVFSMCLFTHLTCV